VIAKSQVRETKEDRKDGLRTGVHNDVKIKFKMDCGASPQQVHNDDRQRQSGIAVVIIRKKMVRGGDGSSPHRELMATFTIDLG